MKIPPGRAEAAVGALEDKDFDALRRIHTCKWFKNRVCIEMWTCKCRGDVFLELVYRSTTIPEEADEKEEEREPVRLYSRCIKVETADQLRSIAMTLQ